MRRLAPRAALALALVVAPVVAVGAGCQSQDSGAAGRFDHYVALGDSYSSGAGLAKIDAASGECQRSALSYPHLVADDVEASLVDVTCSGAGTASAVAPQKFQDGSTVPPQLDAVTARADLVTVGLGYNDSSFFLGLLFGCSQVAPSDPTGAPCRRAAAAAGQELATATEAIGTSLRKLLEAVQRRAPEARVLLVGYPQLVPASGTCPELPLAQGDYAYVREGLERLDGALRQAAEDAEVTFVDVWSASDGHDICAGDDAWINGATNRPGVAAFYHPFATGQRAVAELVADALDG